MGDLDAPPAREIAVEVELLLQLEDLVSRVGRALSLWFHAGLEGAIACNQTEKKRSNI